MWGLAKCHLLDVWTQIGAFLSSRLTGLGGCSSHLSFYIPHPSFCGLEKRSKQRCPRHGLVPARHVTWGAASTLLGFLALKKKWIGRQGCVGAISCHLSFCRGFIFGTIIFLQLTWTLTWRLPLSWNMCANIDMPWRKKAKTKKKKRWKLKKRKKETPRKRRKLGNPKKTIKTHEETGKPRKR